MRLTNLSRHYVQSTVTARLCVSIHRDEIVAIELAESWVTVQFRVVRTPASSLQQPSDTSESLSTRMRIASTVSSLSQAVSQLSNVLEAPVYIGGLSVSL